MQKLKKNTKNAKGKGRQNQKPRPKKSNSMTKVKTKRPSKASQKRRQDSLAVTALENATVAALQVRGLIIIIIFIEETFSQNVVFMSLVMHQGRVV